MNIVIVQQFVMSKKDFFTQKQYKHLGNEKVLFILLLELPLSLLYPLNSCSLPFNQSLSFNTACVWACFVRILKGMRQLRLLVTYTVKANEKQTPLACLP